MSSTDGAATPATAASPETRTPVDDRATKARIRDAAIECIADEGLARATVRRIAARADVSPALVIHHFGSMARLRLACDSHVAGVIRDEKAKAVGSRGFDPLAALRDTRLPALAGYLARVLVDDSPVVERLVDDLIADAEIYLEEGVRAGTLRPTDDPTARATVLGLWSLGSLVLNQHLRRRLGADITSPGTDLAPATARYVAAVLDLMTDGVYTEDFAENARDRLRAMAATTQEEHER